MVRLDVGMVFLYFVLTDPIRLAYSAVQADTSLDGLLVDDDCGGTWLVSPLVTLWWNLEETPGSLDRMLGTCWA